MKTDTVVAVNVILEETEHNHDKMSKRKGHYKENASEDLSSQPSKIIRQELVSIHREYSRYKSAKYSG